MVTGKDGESVMVMSGMPRWLLVAGVALVLLVSFILVERRGTHSSRKPWRVNLIKNRRVYRMVRSRWFQAIPQLAMVAILVGLLYAGLFGSRYRNITPIAVWTIWWAGLVFAVALAGPLFCTVCPWDGATNLVTRLWPGRRVDPLSFGLSVPTWARNMYPAIGLFVLLTWAELGLGATTDPRGTAYMGLGMTVLAICCGLVFADKAFCRHLCPVGRITGIYANFSPVEIRARNPRTCQNCKTEDCLNGNDEGYPCPTGISIKALDEATYCTGCTECVKSCDKYNIALNLRAFGSDLHKPSALRMDEAWMCVILLALTLFHGFSMTSAWQSFEPGQWSLMKWMATTLGTPPAVNFTLGMVGLLAIPIGLYALSCRIAAQWTRRAGVSGRELFAQYAFSILPVALFYHMAHNAMHLLMEGGEIVPMLSDPLGRGDDLLSTAGVNMGSLLSDEAIWYLQVGLIVTGHVFGIVAAHRISRRLFPDVRNAVRSLVPMLAMMIILSTAGLSLMVLEMNMRAGRM